MSLLFELAYGERSAASCRATVIKPLRESYYSTMYVIWFLYT